MLVNIQGKNKVVLLIKLWENQVVADDFRGRVKQLTPEMALEALSEGYVYFVCGKFIKVDFSKDLVDSTDYNAHAGPNALENVVKSMEGNKRENFLTGMKGIKRPATSDEVPGVKVVRGDGLCYWRCILITMRNEFQLPDNIDFGTDESNDIYEYVDMLRTHTADFVDALRSDDSDEWKDVNVTAQGLLEERNETLDIWLERLHTPIKNLEGKTRWADELVFSVTPRMLKSLDFDVDIRVKQWITTNQKGEITNSIDAELPNSASPIVINLRYYVHENGEGYHYDLITDLPKTTNKRRRRPSIPQIDLEGSVVNTDKEFLIKGTNINAQKSCSFVIKCNINLIRKVKTGHSRYIDFSCIMSDKKGWVYNCKLRTLVEKHNAKWTKFSYGINGYMDKNEFKGTIIQGYHYYK